MDKTFCVRIIYYLEVTPDTKYTLFSTYYVNIISVLTHRIRYCNISFVTYLGGVAQLARAYGSYP